MITIFRMVVSLLFLLISLFSIVKAPTNLCWKLSIAVIEWGQYFAIITIAMALLNINHKTILILNILSTVLFLSTTVRAYIQKSVWEEAIQQTFPVKDDKLRNYTLSFKELFAGIDYQTEIPKEYTVDESHQLKLDYYAATAKNAPCVIIVHGGAWSSGDRKQLPRLNSYLAQRGYAVAAISYRLAPENTYATQVEDVFNAVKWIKQHATQLNIDSTHLVLLGRSAGAQLAQQVAYTHIDKDIKGVISFYCPADLVWGYSVPGNPLIMDSRKVLDEFIGASAYARKDLYEAASPAYHITPDAPPTLLLHGIPDVMVAREHSRRMNEKLNKAGVKHVFIDFPWATHGYDFAFNGPSSQISLYAIEHFLENVCETGRP